MATGDKLVNLDALKAVHDADAAEVADLKSALNSMNTATTEDEGKALKAKTVSGGKVTEWEFGDAGSQVVVDPTLTHAGEAADAKTVGDAINATNNKLNDITTTTAIAGKNLFNPASLVSVAEWTFDDPQYYGTATKLANAFGTDGYPFSFSFETGERYTLSLDVYTDNNASGTGVGLRVDFVYSDNTYDTKYVENTVTSWTHNSWTSANNKTISKITLKWASKGANIWHFRHIQLEKKSTETTYEPYGQAGSLTVINAEAIPNNSITKDQLAFDIDEDVTLINASSFPQALFAFEQPGSDMTFANGKLLVFGSSADDHSGYSGLVVYTIDYANKTATKDKTLRHNWGHINSIDYCAGSDTLITSNAGQSTTDEGIIYIVENVSEILALSDQTQVPFATYVKSIDCSGLNFGHKFQLVWGEDNNGRYDIAYLLSDDMATIRKIQLGKGSNEFTYGTIISGAGEDEFNGTFRVIATFTNDLTQQNNGTAFKNGAIYACGTHSGKNIEKMIPLIDGSTYVEKYKEICYSASGTSMSTYGEGIAFDGDYMAFGTGSSIGIYRLT